MWSTDPQPTATIPADGLLDSIGTVSPASESAFEGSGATPSIPQGPCVACGSPLAQRWEAPGGPVRLCAPCATFEGLGCP